MVKQMKETILNISGQVTLGLEDEVESMIIVTRFDYTESVKLLAMHLFGELTYNKYLKLILN